MSPLLLIVMGLCCCCNLQSLTFSPNGMCRPESALMMRTLRDMNMSKFVAEDVPLFLSLIQDLFPAQKTDRSSSAEVQVALEKVRSACNQ